jgi:Protein of unknown function (DUF3341)
MSTALLAEYRHARELKRAAGVARRRNYRLIDAFTPHYVEGLSEVLGVRRSNIRVVMFIAGICVAAAAYFAGEYYTAVVNYPYNSGGRPLDAWPAFMLVPFATGILGASIAGFATFLIENRLPALHHFLFDVADFERASQDRFWLMLMTPDKAGDKQEALDLLRQSGALSVREVST